MIGFHLSTEWSFAQSIQRISRHLPFLCANWRPSVRFVFHRRVTDRAVIASMHNLALNRTCAKSRAGRLATRWGTLSVVYQRKIKITTVLPRLRTVPAVKFFTDRFPFQTHLRNTFPTARLFTENPPLHSFKAVRAQNCDHASAPNRRDQRPRKPIRLTIPC